MIYQTYGPSSTVGTYLGHAKQLTDAAMSLDRQRSGIAGNMLLGHALEVTLKAWLLAEGLKRGEPLDKVKRTLAKAPFGHDLQNLWDAAVREGLAIPTSRPIWFEYLAAMHGAPFRVRYPPNAVAFPVPEDTVCNHVLSLIEIIANASGLTYTGN
mgnify:CR=1 FL=1